MSLLKAGVSLAQVVPVNFSGSGLVACDEWLELNKFYKGLSNNSSFSRYPGNGSWPYPVPPSGPNSNATGSARLIRLAGNPSGGPFFAEGSIYFFSTNQLPNDFGGTLAITNSSPLTNLQTIVLQLQIGQASGYDFRSPAGFPYLKINGSTNTIPASYPGALVGIYEGLPAYNYATGLFEPLIIKTLAFQWSLTNTLSVTSFAVEFSCVTHSQIYALRLDQSSTLQSAQVFSTSSEPPQISLLALGSPQFDSSKGVTSITHSFTGPTNKTIDIEFCSNLSIPSWSTNTGIVTGTGVFTNTFSGPGDQRAAWSGKMFFRAKYSQ